MFGIISTTIPLQLRVAPVRWRIEFKGFRRRTLSTKTEIDKFSDPSGGNCACRAAPNHSRWVNITQKRGCG